MAGATIQILDLLVGSPHGRELLGMLLRSELAGQAQIALSNGAIVRVGRHAENSVRVHR